jgi:DNA-binding response OmpR family regulator
MKTKILVVDDVSAIRQMMGALLGNAGYDVLTAATVEEAVKIADQSQPDLMVVDVRMGDHNGLQVAVRERARGRTIPIIVMSGHNDPVLVAEAERLGATFLLKPFDPDHLLARVEWLLRQQERERPDHQ